MFGTSLFINFNCLHQLVHIVRIHSPLESGNRNFKNEIKQLKLNSNTIPFVTENVKIYLYHPFLIIPFSTWLVHVVQILFQQFVNVTKKIQFFILLSEVLYSVIYSLS